MDFGFWLYSIGVESITKNVYCPLNKKHYLIKKL